MWESCPQLQRLRPPQQQLPTCNNPETMEDNNNLLLHRYYYYYYSAIWNSEKSAILVSNSSEIGSKQNWMSWTITVTKVARFRTLWRTYLNYLFYVLAAQTSASQEGAKFKKIRKRVWKNNSRDYKKISGLL